MSQAKGQIVKYQKAKHCFKVVCNPGTVLQYREGKLGIEKVLQIDIVFTNVVRGDRAPQIYLEEVFGNLSNDEILKKIVKEGEIEYSANERKKFMDDKLAEISYIISKNWIDPKTKLPHTIDRIKNAINQNKKKINIDLKKDSKRQAEDIVKKLAGVLMFAKASIYTVELTIKYAYDGKCKNIIHSIVSKVLKEDYSAEGCVYTVEMTKAETDSLTNALNKPTNGDFGFQILDYSNSAASTPKSNKKEKSGKDKKKKKKASSKNGLKGQEIANKMMQEQKQQESAKMGKNVNVNAHSSSNVSSQTQSESQGFDDSKKKKKRRKKNKNKNKNKHESANLQ